MGRHRYPINVRFRDIDSLGHVNNAVYLTYFEEARWHFLHEVFGDIDWTGEALIVARNEVDFIQPILITYTIEVETRVVSMGNKSMVLGIRVLQVAGDQDILMARGKTVMVAYDYKTEKAIPLLDSWRKTADEFGIEAE